MNPKKLVLGLFLLLLLINVVSAQEDFTATSSSSVELCPCSNQGYAVTVRNTGSIASSYELIAGGDAAEWVTYSPSSFVLNPGQAGNFFVYVNSMCNVKDNFGLETYIRTNNGLIKVVKQTLKISECYDYTLSQGEVVSEANNSLEFLEHDGSYYLCENEQKSIPILITNNENFDNQYRFFLDAPEWAKLNAVSAKLGAKQSGIFLINFDTIDVKENFNFKLDVISELGKVQRKENIEVNVNQCYVLEVEIEEEQDVVCGGENKKYDVFVRNPGTLSQDVKLAAEGAEWTSFGNIVVQPIVPEEDITNLSDNNLSDNESESVETLVEETITEENVLQLNPGEEKNVLLNLNPPGETSGSFAITVNAIPESKNAFNSSDTINIDVVEKIKCYEADISTKSSVTNLYKEDFFFAKVINNGLKRTTYGLSLDGPSWISVSPDNLELNPGQTGNVNLRINPPEIESGIYGIKIKAEAEGAIYAEDVNIRLRKETAVEKNLKLIIKNFRYTLYSILFILLLAFIFRKRIGKTKNNLVEKYKKYKTKRARLNALKLARDQRKKEKEEKVRIESSAKSAEKTIKEKRKFDWGEYKKWIYSFVAVIIILAFIGHNNGLYDLKYLNIYVWNFVYGYLYYILIGAGTAFTLFLLFLFFNYVAKRKKRAKKEVKKADKKTMKKKKKWGKILISVGVSLILIGLVSALTYFNLFDEVKDFFILYSNYFILGIVILVAIIIVIRSSKPLQKFFKE